MVKITAASRVDLGKQLHVGGGGGGGSVRPLGAFIYITATDFWDCVCKTCGVNESRNDSLLSLSLSFILHLALSSPLYCPTEAEAQLDPRGARRTDVAGRRGRGRDEQPKPGCFLQI